MTTTLIVGCGYLGQRVAERLGARGETVIGTVRSKARAEVLESRGIVPVIADVLDSATLDGLPAADRVFFCVGFDRSAGVPMREVYVEGLRRVLDRIAGRTGRFVYAGSTGVYGQSDGAWIDETAPAEPVSASGQVVREAEQLIEAFRRDRGLDAVVLRFSGLYGPGRTPRRANLERGEPVPGNPDHWLNMIEIRDAAACAVAALDQQAPPSRLYNATDDRPTARSEFYGTLARHLGLPAPIFLPPDPESREARRDASHKRVSNRRIKEELGVILTYPTIATGIPAALGSETRSR